MLILKDYNYELMDGLWNRSLGYEYNLLQPLPGKPTPHSSYS